MKWTEDMSVGNERIDEQHKELFEKINDLLTAIRSKTCKHTIGDVIKFLGDYAVFHFGQEELMMIESDYPDYPSHRAQHELFMRNFAALKKELPKLEGGRKPGSYDLSVETNQVVVDWIIDHIGEVDKKFGAYLKENGLE